MNQTIDDVNIIESLGLPTCKIFTFLQYYSLQCISWLLMSVSIDQGLKVYFPHSRYILNPKLSYGFAIVRLNFILKKINYIKTPKSFKATMIILFGINVHILLFVGKVSFVKQNVTNNLNITEEVSIRTFDCYNSNFYVLAGAKFIRHDRNFFRFTFSHCVIFKL